MAEISSVIQHASLTGDNIHVAYAGSYADETARLAAKLDTSMEGKLYRQHSDNSLWMLVSAAKKTWISLGKDTAKYLGNGGNDKDPMTFYWEAQEGQPTGVWGGNDGKNMYVYNPANFNVNSAKTANSADSANYANSAGSAPANGGISTACSGAEPLRTNTLPPGGTWAYIAHVSYRDGDNSYDKMISGMGAGGDVFFKQDRSPVGLARRVA